MRILINDHTPNPHLECDCGNWITLRWKDATLSTFGGYTYFFWACYQCGQTYRQETPITIDVSLKIKLELEKKNNQLPAQEN